MKGFLIVVGGAALVVSFGIQVSAGAEIERKPLQSPVNGYAGMNGLKMYYEIQGIGRPLMLIHGGVCTIDTCFEIIRPLLAKNWKTVAVELQGHGHTADVARSLTFEQMTEDTAALLRQLKIFKGWRPSDIQSIKASVLVMIGDADIVQPEHAVQMFRLFPHAQMTVLPGTDHFAPIRRPDWIVPMVEAFLNAPMPKGPGKGEITK